MFSKELKTLSVTVVAVLIAMASPGAKSARADAWTRKADMPTARNFLHTNVVNGKIYAIGAIQPAGLLSTVEAYDPVADTWTKKADMPTPRTFIDSSVVDGKIYVMGGEAYWTGPLLATVEAYDPVTDTWTKKADMPAPRSSFFTGVVNGKIYTIGGTDVSYNGGREVSTVEMYDPATDAWMRKADMPTPRAIPNVCVMNEKIYVIGGQTENGPQAAYAAVEVYDPVTDTWSRRGDMPWPRTGAGSIVVHDKIYCFGGRTTKYSAPLSTVLQYDPAIDVWTDRGDMPGINAFMGVSTVGGKIYLIGGSTSISINDMLSTVWEFTPASEFDFNGDDVVDAQDVTLLVDHWHTDSPRYDVIADGIVDAQDLVALSEHLFEDYRLLAHWMLDETEGMFVYDSAGVNDGIVLGNPVWQPEDGQVGGALAFDGIDDVIIVDPVLNPADGPFSVFAWLKGGEPGQAILAQQGGVNWLQADVNEALMTELTKSGGRREGVPLHSKTIISDDNWHRVGLVWDGANRILYVDDVEVARDTLTGLDSADGGLRIGAGGKLGPDSFWSGMIDDVRIYDRAIVP